MDNKNMGVAQSKSENHRPFLRWSGKKIHVQQPTFPPERKYPKRTYIFMIVLSEAVISPYM
jgi:hypothetical protein